MKPKKKLSEPQNDMFKPRLEDIVSPAHPLVRLAAVIDWDRIDQELDHHFATVGASALPTRLMTGLMYLQHMHNLSDCQRRFKFDPLSGGIAEVKLTHP